MSPKRQLAAIMFTDIEGYTALMQDDEKNAVHIRFKHREIFNSVTKKYNGEIIQYYGDGTLSIFSSSVEAIKCGIEMQRAFQQEPSIPVRIGVHAGDIIKTESDIIGDAVNVASRIESLAVAGSILISGEVNDQLRNQNDIDSKFMDSFEFKNVDQIMPVFAITNKGIVVPKKGELSGKTKEKLRKKSRFNRNSILMTLGIIAIITSFF
ncbi:MAG: adenylate/guanylate cyclase domain-containing protein, partial [Flavobacteriaceae bacterium]